MTASFPCDLIPFPSCTPRGHWRVKFDLFGGQLEPSEVGQANYDSPPIDLHHNRRILKRACHPRLSKGAAQYVGNCQSWMRAPWLTCEETPAPYRFSNVDLNRKKQHTYCIGRAKMDDVISLVSLVCLR